MRKVNSKTLYLAAATAAATLVTTGTAAAYTLHKTITVEVDGQKTTISGFQSGTVEEFLKQQGIKASPQDQILPGLSAPLTSNMDIKINRIHSVKLIDGSQGPQTIHTFSQTVGEMLDSLRLTIGANDSIDVPLDTPIESGQTIQITRREQNVAVSEEKIPFQTERQPDQSMYKGQEKTLTSGVEGLARITTTVNIVNGKEVDRQSKREVIHPPVNQVTVYGTKDRPVTIASRSGANFTAARKMIMEATAYSMPGSRTATGMVARRGVVAVDPNVIPLGTKLYIEGYGYAIAADTGGAIHGNIIDLHFDTTAEAIQFGRRTVTVYVVQ